MQFTKRTLSALSGPGARSCASVARGGRAGGAQDGPLAPGALSHPLGRPSSAGGMAARATQQKNVLLSLFTPSPLAVQIASFLFSNCFVTFVAPVAWKGRRAQRRSGEPGGVELSWVGCERASAAAPREPGHTRASNRRRCCSFGALIISSTPQCDVYSLSQHAG